MNQAAIFTQAHTITKKTVKAGDDYRVTFGACLKLIYSKLKEKVVSMRKPMTHEEQMKAYYKIKEDERAKREAERKEALLKKGKEARKINKTLGLKTLKGSTKQKAWGEKLRAEFVKTVDSEKALTFIESLGVAQSAKFWIETRNVNYVELEQAMHDLIEATAKANQIGAGNDGYDEQLAIRSSAIKTLKI